MTSCFHSYHSIKPIHCGAPQRDVQSDKMVFLVVTHSFYFMLCQSFKYCYELCIQRRMAVTHVVYFMLCQSSLLSTVISFVYKDKLWFDESTSVIFCMIIHLFIYYIFVLHDYKIQNCNEKG